jgi:hypothetical protein
MGAVTQGVPIKLAAMLASELRITHAIETGTYFGTSAAALAHEFEQVWTIELSPDLHRKALDRFGHLPNLHLIQGSSAEVLSRAIAESNAPTLFWLDSHWSGGITAGQEHECPIMDEIAQIDASEHAATSCILIDDARYFLGPPPPPATRDAWPTFMVVMDTLRTMKDRYVTVLDDVVIAVPACAQRALDDYWLGVLAEPDHYQMLLRAALRSLLAKAIKGLQRVFRRRLHSTGRVTRPTGPTG